MSVILLRCDGIRWKGGWGRRMYQFVPPSCLVDVLYWADGLEDAGVVDEDVSVSVLLLDLFEERGYRRWIGNVRGDRERLDIGMGFGDRVGYFLEFVRAAGYEDDGFGACGSERGNERLYGVLGIAGGLSIGKVAHPGSEALACSSDDHNLALLRECRLCWVNGRIYIAVGGRHELLSLDEVVDREVLHLEC